MNTTTNTTDLSMEDDGVRRQVMKITLLIIGSATVLLNIFVIILILSVKSLRSNANIIIGSMAVTDLFAGIAAISAALLKWTDWFQVHGLVCEVHFTIDGWAAYASLTHVLAVNVERYLAIVFPLKYKNIVSVRRLQIVLLFIWLVSLVEAVAYTFAYNLGKNCILMGTVLPGLAFGILVVAIAVPMLLVIGIYIHIVVVIIRKFKFMAKTSSADQETLAQSQRKMFVVVSAILAAWIICWLPLMCVIMAITFAHAFNISLDISQFVTMLYYVEIMSYGNSLLNPILYFLTSRDFSKAGLTIFKCKLHDESNNSKMQSNQGSLNAETSITKL